MSKIREATYIAQPEKLFIGGKWTEPSTDATFDVINSGTEELFFRVAEAQEADVERAVAAARAAFDQGPWPRMNAKERASYLSAIADELDARSADTANSWTVESGIVQSLSVPISAHVGGIYREYAAHAETFPFIEEHGTASGAQFGYLVREPVGVVAAIVPWNGPALLGASKCAPALLAGCTVILKASPEAPSFAYLLAEICEKIGLPAGVINVLTADREVSEKLVQHPDVDKVSFTGSTAAGRRIASICGERIARCTLELGGKSAAVILDDFDVATAAQSIVDGSTMLSGQVCAALTRIVVNRSKHDAMVDALAASFEKIRVGDPFDAESQMGPLASRRQRQRVESYIEAGKADGATLATGGGRPAHLDRGFFVEPTVFGDVDNHSRIAREEIFGPVLSVIAAQDDEDAIRIANDSIYGLNASVYTNDVDRAWRASRALRSGTVGHNAKRSDFHIAFGGFKQSGIGREGGEEGIYPYCETKTVLIDGRPSIL